VLWVFCFKKKAATATRSKQKNPCSHNQSHDFMSKDVSNHILTQEQVNLKVVFLVKQYLKFIEEGFKPGVAFESLAKMGYDYSHRSLRNHVKLFEATGRAIKGDYGKAGKKRKLDPTQEALVKQEVETCNAGNLKTSHRKLMKFVKETMGIDVSMSTKFAA
jgi:hypothetical protein